MTAIGAYVVGDEILSGKRADKHLAHLIATLGARGLGLDYAHYVGDDRGRLTALLRGSFGRGDLAFSFGGIGATPDDHTRQAAAAALDVPLAEHPEAVAGIVARFGDAAYPHRVLIAHFPQGAAIIPNPVNGVAGFSIRDHHFLPGLSDPTHPLGFTDHDQAESRSYYHHGLHGWFGCHPHVYDLCCQQTRREWILRSAPP